MTSTPPGRGTGEPARLLGTSDAARLIGHDLKQALDVAERALEEIQRDGSNGAHDAIVQLRRALAQADELADGLLKLSREHPVERQPIHIQEFLSSREPVMKMLLPTEVTLSLRLLATGGTVIASPDELDHIVLNLVRSSGLAMRGTGDLTIGTGWLDHVAGHSDNILRPARHIRLTVGDTGGGSDADAHDRVLRPPTNDGAIAVAPSVAAIVHRLGGYLILESETGEGSRIHVCLPAIPQTAKT